ncbi:phenylalanine--tRNA ligase subunit beta [Boudabousia tangfeifanii]|uniref:Phenylalanine--tRNA ligase beta subunit n=1 Tax=Boudabousia tangfeifanii TaxID=1912795 RepID=A0A1D9MK74_9ACTO|nr:phenylalanine--tRNA ligase subunit beta [Boudabousia tangfeifanii]AOZ72751.1 phenylalanine--tRNA ligase subunit beta [Boudabousia tangfeifanii]
MPYVSLEWLNSMVSLKENTTIEEVAKDLVKVGLEEEQIVPPPVTGPLVVGKVLTRDPKEQSNGKVINYCRVDVGQYNDEPGTGKEPSELPSRGIICGAHNFEVGDHVVVSLPGAVLPGGFEIAARKTYGHISDGMMCSEAELGLAASAEGIIVLDKYLDGPVPEVGSDAVALLGLGEELLEINITPDRGYCFSMRGVAREYAHSTGAKFVDPGVPGNLVASLPENTEDAFPVVLADQAPIRGNQGCDRFVTRVVTGIDPSAPTPDWMVRRLQASGMRSLSLTVDITNYVMLELGQPLHAYDLSAVSAPLVVRRAKAGEKLTTLDEVERELNPEDLLITDSPEGEGSRVLALAGVMGGASSEVNENTTAVLVEAAHFDSVSVARTARRHKLPSEAAKRFERGVDPQLAPVAAQRVVDLLVELAGGTDAGRVLDLNETKPAMVFEFDPQHPARLVGVEIDNESVKRFLTEIGCEIDDSGELWQVTVPSWRPDLTGPAHLVEEVARLHGYEELPSILPQISTRGSVPQDLRSRRQVAATLAASGMTQVLSYPFVSNSHDRQLLAEDDPRRQALKLYNPMADDAPWLRTSLLDTLLDVARRNLARGNDSFAIFEQGMVSRAGDIPAATMPEVQTPNAEQIATIMSQVPAQPWHLAGVLAGNRAPLSVLEETKPFAWNDAINAANLAASAVGANLLVATPLVAGSEPEHVNLRAMAGQGIEPMPQAWLAPWHPGRVAQLRVRLGKRLTVVGYAGELHPKVCQNFNLPARTCAFELDLSALCDSVSDQPKQVATLSTFPLAKEDLAVVLPAAVSAAEVLVEVKKAAGPLLAEARLFDVYSGKQLSEGEKSLAFSLKMRGDHTLEAKETTALRERVLAALKKKFGASLR